MIAATYSYAKPYLFTLYDLKGQILKQFGEHFDKKINKLSFKDFIYSDVDLRINQDSLYVFFRRLPTIHVYNMEGNFVRSIDVKVDFVKKTYPHNINPKKVVEGYLYKLKDWMRGAFVDDDNFYCFALRQGKMLVLDHSGNLLETIPFAQKEPLDAYAPRKFIFKESDKFCFTDMREGQILIYKLVRE